MLSDDIDVILYEGEIYKYKPGINITYIKRWAQITKREFKYYKDRYHSSQWLAKPLGSISLSDIDKILRVDINLGNKKKGSQKLEKAQYQFEIFPNTQMLIQDDQPQRNYSVSLIADVSSQKLDYEKYAKEKGKELVKVKRLQATPPKNSSAWTMRQKEWELAENRLLFALPMKEECDKWILLLNWLVDIIKQEIAGSNEN